MRVTKAMVETASEAYASKRHPARWDGEPWGLAGTKNHELAIRTALKSIFKEYKLTKKEDK
jgi:hypothetical protein